MTNSDLNQYTVRVYEDYIVEASTPEEAIEHMRYELEQANEHGLAAADMEVVNHG